VFVLHPFFYAVVNMLYFKSMEVEAQRMNLQFLRQQINLVRKSALSFCKFK
jgi:hypothetical protein